MSNCKFLKIPSSRKFKCAKIFLKFSKHQCVFKKNYKTRDSRILAELMEAAIGTTECPRKHDSW